MQYRLSEFFRGGSLLLPTSVILDVKSALLMTCPYLLADVSLADAAMLWLTPHVASARYRNISQRGIIRKKVDDSSFLNGIHIFFLM